ncbi:hypothetical protein [Marinifilum sp.]|uniref:hypothetical protein n=1 Tax=Marinifilum sp. TaxID=2033137 RepID=UPI003BAD1976
MKKIYSGCISFLLIFLLALSNGSYGNNSSYSSMLKLTNIDLIEGESVHNIPVREQLWNSNAIKILAREKILLKVKRPSNAAIYGGIGIKGKLKIQNVFQLTDQDVFASVKQNWYGINNKSLPKNQVFYHCINNKEYLYVVVANENNINTHLKEVDWFSEKELNQMIFSKFVEEFFLIAILMFMAIVFLIVYLTFRARLYAFYLLGLLSALAYSFYLFDINSGSRLNDALIRSFGLVLLFNYFFIYESIKCYLGEKLNRMAKIGLNIFTAFTVLSVLSVVFDFWYFFETELFVWIVAVLACTAFLIKAYSKIKAEEKILLFKTLVFNLSMLLMISQYFDAISNNYLSIFLIGMVTKEIMLCAYYAKKITILKKSNGKKLLFIKRLKDNYNEAYQEKNLLKNELLETEEKIVQNTMMIEDKEKLIIDLERLLKSNLDTLKMSKVKPILNKIQEIESHIGIKQFDFHFQRVNQDLFDKLQSFYPQLTSNDLKLCAFMRMNLNSKEIAAITGKSPSSIDVSKFRLRKKLGVASNSDLQLLLSSKLNENIA